jgi:HEPN domain-containing protein
MSPREFLIRDTREWLTRANSDLRACGALVAGELPAEAVFHAQQCAEKALKAFLTWNQTPFKKTHDLRVLRQLCLPFIKTPIAHLEDAEKLTKYAWRFRYPGAPYSPDREEAERAMRMASLLLDAITADLTLRFNDSETENSQA